MKDYIVFDNEKRTNVPKTMINLELNSVNYIIFHFLINK